MAVDEQDWSNFLDSTKESDEVVENDDTSEDEDQEEENGGAGGSSDDDKSTEQGKSGKSTKDDSDEDSGEDEEDEDSEKGKKSDDTPYKPKLKQFLNDDGNLDPEKIEKAYIESSKNGVELDGKLKATTEKYEKLVDAIKNNPEAAKLLLGEKGAKALADGKKSDDQQLDPVAQHIKAQLDRTSKEEYDAFIKDHPEAVTDPEKAKQIGEFLEMFGPHYRKTHNGEFPSMKEGLENAYRYYGWELEIDKKEDVANAAKNKAATRHTPNKKTPAPKKQQNQQEQYFAKKLGVNLVK